MRVLRPPLLAAAAFLAGSAPLMGAGTTEFTAGHLFVALKNQGRIVELDRNGSEVRSFGQDKAFNGLWDLCFAPDGRLFASSRNDDRIAAFRADLNGYEETQYVPASGVDGPQGLAFGPGGSLFVASTHLDSVVDVTSGKRYEANPWFANLDGPTGVTLSPDGRLIAAAYFSDNLVEYSLEGHPVSQTSTQSGPEFLAWALNRLFIACGGANKIVGPGGALSNPSLAYPMDMVVGPDLELFAASYQNGRIVTYPEQVLFEEAGSGPIGLARAPWRFRVEIKGSLSGAAGKVERSGILSYFPGDIVVYLELDAGPGAFQGGAVVFHGYEQHNPKKALRLFSGHQRPRVATGEPRAHIALTLKEKRKKGSFFDLKRAKGTLHLSNSGAVLEGTIRTKKRLN